MTLDDPRLRLARGKQLKARALELHAQGMAREDIAAELDVSTSTVYRYVPLERDMVYEPPTPVGHWDPDVAWKTEGLCRQVDGELFYPDKGGSTKEGKAVCGHCPVRQRCLDFALRHDERFGIWGGHSERERRAIRKQRQDTDREAS